MMASQMDKTTASSPRERAQSIFDQTLELEKKRWKAAQARVPFDPNLWHQIRENFEAIILEDHTFAEQHSVEFHLWQLHYKRIEDFRSHINAALLSSSSSAAPNAKGASKPDRIAKLKLQFRQFLSEASGFYHDMILKIRSKYGLPLGYFSEDQDCQNLADKDAKKKEEVKRAAVSCHRCLIYLGDLARYKGVFGEGDSKNREYAAASSYYLQAVSLLPASGNPHHQLAITASYSGDELTATYRYFRSLAAESPFPTARDNLIVAFEKNRQSYAQLLVVSKDSSKKLTRKGRGKGENISSKDANLVSDPEKDKVTIANEMLKAFCIRFVRLNGILFTRTSMETFLDVLASTSSSLHELISSGVVEELKDTSETALFMVRVVAVLVFSVHNSKKETEGLSYAEIVQRVEPARNSVTASFELIGHLVEKCTQLRDPSTSYFLPGVLVFVEWLACCPDIALGRDSDDRQTAARTSFWNQCITFFNQVLALGPMFIDDVEDENCFSNMSIYDERETENRLALSEDHELRGFVPLLPAQTILDFSRKHSFGTEGPKEKKARIKRILAAGKSLTSVIKIDQNHVYFDSKKKKFLVGVKPYDDVLDSHPSQPDTDNTLLDNRAVMSLNSPLLEREQQIYLDEEDDDDEVIVFKPLVAEKRKGASDQIYVSSGGFRMPDQIASMGDLKALSGSDSAFRDNLLLQAGGSASIQVPASASSNHPGFIHPSTQSQAVHLQQLQTQVVHPQPAQSLAAVRHQPIQPPVAQHQQLQSRGGHFQQTQAQVSHVSPAQSQSASLGVNKWLPEEAASVASSLTGFTQMGNGLVMRNEVQGNHSQMGNGLVMRNEMQGNHTQMSNGLVMRNEMQGNHTQMSNGLVMRSEMQGNHTQMSNGLVMRNEMQGNHTQMSNGLVMRNEMQGNHTQMGNGQSMNANAPLPIHQSFNVNGMGGMPYSQSRAPEAALPPKIDAVSSSGVTADGLGVQTSIAKKNPISRAFRHLGPPPGFNSVPSKLPKEPTPTSDLSGNNVLVDDYSWLDGYQAQSSLGTGLNRSLNYSSSGKPEHMGTNNGMNGAAIFPFPGKQGPSSQVQSDFLLFQNPQQDTAVNANHQSAQLPEQYQGQSSWPSRHFV